MQSYTLYDMDMNIEGKKYILPSSTSDNDTNITQKVVSLIKSFDGDLTLFQTKTHIEIEIKNVYNSDDGNDYLYVTVIELFRYNHSNHSITYEDGKPVENNQTMVSIRIDVEEDDDNSIQELIKKRVLPYLEQKLDLKNFIRISL